jgi:Anti-sigma-K factor rskA
MSDETSDPTFDRLGQALPRVAPTEGLLDRILAATDAGSPVPEAAAAPRPPRRRIRRRPAILVAFAAAATVAAAAIALEPSGSLGPAAARAEISSPAAANPLEGRAALYRPTRPGGRLMVKLRNVPPPPRGTHYEVWVLPEGSSQMTAVGSFTPSGSGIDLVLPLPGPDRYRAIDISIQDNNGSPARSSRTLGSGLFEPTG